MSKYITAFQQTGDSTINVDLVCKDWNDRFSICTWINGDEERYTFIVNGKRKNTSLCKTQISKEQAFSVVDRLNLIHVKDSTFRSAGAFHGKSFIKSKVELIAKIKQEKENELAIILGMLYQYERCLDKVPCVSVKGNVVRYAWGNSTLKTWFITKSNKAFLPKGCKLLFKILGEQTNEPIHTADTYPKQGDVILDVDGFNIKVVDVIWI